MIDFMALVQSFPLSKLPSTYGELALALLNRILQIASQFRATRVDIVGDCYHRISIKEGERTRRCQSVQEVKIYGSDQRRPSQWKKFLTSGKNKQALQCFIADHLKLVTHSTSVALYVALTTDVFKLLFNPDQLPQTTDCPEMRSDHEEADTRLVLHAKIASQHHENVIIWSPDTDVAVIGISHCSSIPAQVFFATGSGKNQRLVCLSEIADQLGDEKSRNLPALHAFSGCDTTSSFYGKGKKSIAITALSDQNHLKALSGFGQHFQLSVVPEGIENLVCKIYNSAVSSVNDARYELFRTGSATDRSLPPNYDALTLHCKRANYQTKVWRSALMPIMNCPSPDNQGWKIVDEQLEIAWLSEPHAPSDILKTRKCSCKKTNCKGGKCLCVQDKLRCTALCSCLNCENKMVENLSSDEDLDDDDNPDECFSA